MASRELSVYLVVGETRAGLWCPGCALPSRVEVDVWMLTRCGMSKVGTHTACTGHDELGGADVLDR